MRNRWNIAGAAALLLTLSACGGGGDDTADTTTTSTVFATIETSTAPVLTTAAVVETTTTTSEAPVPAVSNYTLQPGESLGVVADKFGVSVADIVAANSIADPDRVQAGQVLVIPAAGATAAGADSATTETTAAPSEDSTDTTAAASGTTAPAAQPDPADGTAYTVQDGESLGFIAIKFDTTVAAIVAANGLSDPDRVRAGDTIIIPNG